MILYIIIWIGLRIEMSGLSGISGIILLYIIHSLHPRVKIGTQYVVVSTLYSSFLFISSVSILFL